MSGRVLNENLGKLHFWLFVVGFHLTFDFMHVPGILGMPRRIYTYEPGRGWEVWNLIVTIGVFLQAAAMLVFAVNLLWSYFRGGKAGIDPWDAWPLLLIWAVLSHNSVWYPANLLAAGFFPERVTMAQLTAFHGDALLIGAAIVVFATVLVGLLYGAVLPMFPRHPILLGGVAVPIIGSAVRFLRTVTPAKRSWPSMTTGVMMTNTADTTIDNSTIPSEFPGRGRIGMFGLIAAESAIFTIFVVAYLFYLGKSLMGPTPKEVLAAPVFYTICLLSSSLTIHLAVRRLRQGNVFAFAICWLATIALGGAFLWGTASEWHRFVHGYGWRPSRSSTLMGKFSRADMTERSRISRLAGGRWI
jgi:hypothetical protein